MALESVNYFALYLYLQHERISCSNLADHDYCAVFAKKFNNRNFSKEELLFKTERREKLIIHSLNKL